MERYFLLLGRQAKSSRQCPVFLEGIEQVPRRLCWNWEEFQEYLHSQQIAAMERYFLLPGRQANSSLQCPVFLLGSSLLVLMCASSRLL